VQVVDLSNGGAKLRGQITLPMDPSGYYYGGWGWYGCYYWDWYDGADVVQVGGSTLAFRRWDPNVGAKTTGAPLDDASSHLFVVDLSNPDNPSIASTVITSDPTGWWGNMRVVGSTLYTSHYEWTYVTSQASGSANAGGGDAQIAIAIEAGTLGAGPTTSDAQAASPGTTKTLPDAGTTKIADAGTTKTLGDGGPTNPAPPPQPTARYYLDRIDLSDLKHPRIGSKINVPGALVGGSPSDPSILYTIDYSWDGDMTRDSLDVVKIAGDLAYLQSETPIDGWVGNVIVRGTAAYMTSQVYYDKLQSGQPNMVLHQIDLSNPQAPVDRVASGMGGWGWLLDVQGDRAMVTSGWGPDGLDIYRLSSTAAPVYDQFVRTRGWSVNSLARQNNQIFLSSGYWGVQAVTLN
jgi:hypothetical protein